MNLGVNSETKKRTLSAIAAVINDAVLPAVILLKDNYGFGFWLYFAFSLIANVIVVWNCTYYNNDYTPEANTGTLLAREMKANAEKPMEYCEEPEDSEVTDDDN